MEIAFCIHVYHRARSNCWKEDFFILDGNLLYRTVMGGGAKIYTCSIKRRWKDWKGALVEDQDKYNVFKNQISMKHISGFFFPTLYNNMVNKTMTDLTLDCMWMWGVICWPPLRFKLAGWFCKRMDKTTLIG